MSRKIAVLASGANGSCTAADLVMAGHDVVLIDQWPEHVEAMRASGLTISMPEEEVRVGVRAHHLCDACTFTDRFDIVFLFAKAYDTRWLAELIAPYLAEDGLLIGVQNAMTVDDIIAAVGRERTLGCVVELSSELFTPAHVQRNSDRTKTWFGIGSLDTHLDHRVDEVAALLGTVGQVSVSDDIKSAKWTKLVVNTMCLGPTAMSGLNVAEALALPGMQDFVQRVGEEALLVGQELGYRNEAIFGLETQEIEGSNRSLQLMLDRLTQDIGPRARDCTLQDHLKGRYSEVDLINGLIVTQAAARGRAAPANQAVVELTRRIHAGELKPEPANLERALAIATEGAQR